MLFAAEYASTEPLETPEVEEMTANHRIRTGLFATTMDTAIPVAPEQSERNDSVG